MTEHALILCREPGRHSTLDKGHEEGGSAYANAGLPMQEMQEMESSISGSGRSSEIGNGNPLQYSCLENSMDRGAWWTIVHGAIKSWTRLFSQHSDKGCVHISSPLANLFSRHVLPFSEAKVQSLYGNTKAEPRDYRCLGS